MRCQWSFKISHVYLIQASAECVHAHNKCFLLNYYIKLRYLDVIFIEHSGPAACLCGMAASVLLLVSISLQPLKQVSIY